MSSRSVYRAIIFPSLARVDTATCQQGGNPREQVERVPLDINSIEPANDSFDTPREAAARPRLHFTSLLRGRGELFSIYSNNMSRGCDGLCPDNIVPRSRGRATGSAPGLCLHVNTRPTPALEMITTRSR